MIELLMTVLALQAPVNDAQFREVAHRIEVSINQGDGSELDRLVDVTALVDRALKDTPGSDGMKQGFRKGVISTFNLGKALSATVKQKEGSYRFLRLRTEEGKTTAVFRMIIGDTFNYHHFLLESGPGGTLRANDVLVMLSGEWMSDTFRRMYLGAVAAEPEAHSKLSGAQNEYIKSINKISQMHKLRSQGKAAEALKIYATLSNEAKKDKIALLTRYTAALEAAPDDIPKIVEEFEKTHPGDPSLPAISIGVHWGAGRYDKALAAVDAVDWKVGGDPYLHVQRANIHVSAKNYAKARTAALKAIEGEKDLLDAYWVMVSITLEERKYAETVTWLTKVEKDLGIGIADLTQIEVYAGFVKSPEYAAWMKRR